MELLAQRASPVIESQAVEMPISELHQLSLLMTLAMKKGHTVDASVVPGRWRLFDREQRTVRTPGGLVALTLEEAKAYLITLRDV